MFCQAPFARKYWSQWSGMGALLLTPYTLPFPRAASGGPAMSTRYCSLLQDWTSWSWSLCRAAQTLTCIWITCRWLGEGEGFVEKWVMAGVGGWEWEGIPDREATGIKNKGKTSTATGRPASLAWSQFFCSSHPNDILDCQDQNIQMRQGLTIRTAGHIKRSWR